MQRLLDYTVTTCLVLLATGLGLATPYQEATQVHPVFLSGGSVLHPVALLNGGATWIANTTVGTD